MGHVGTTGGQVKLEVSCYLADWGRVPLLGKLHLSSSSEEPRHGAEDYADGEQHDDEHQIPGGVEQKQEKRREGQQVGGHDAESDAENTVHDQFGTTGKRPKESHGRLPMNKGVGMVREGPGFRGRGSDGSTGPSLCAGSRRHRLGRLGDAAPPNEELPILAAVAPAMQEAENR